MTDQPYRPWMSYTWADGRLPDAPCRAPPCYSHGPFPVEFGASSGSVRVQPDF